MSAAIDSASNSARRQMATEVQADDTRGQDVQLSKSPASARQPAGSRRDGTAQSSSLPEREQDSATSAVDNLGFQTGLSLLDTQNLDELAGVGGSQLHPGKQPAFHRAMSMLSTMGSMGTMTYPIAQPAWDSEEDEGSATDEGTGMDAESYDSDDISAHISTSGISASGRHAMLASRQQATAQTRSAGAALEAGRQQREATAARAGADVRPIFMKALQILHSGRPEAPEDLAGMVERPESVQSLVAASTLAHAGVPDEAGSSAAPTEVAWPSSSGGLASTAIADASRSAPCEATTGSRSDEGRVPPAEQDSEGRSGAAPTGPSAAAKPFVPAASDSVDKASGSSVALGVRTHSTAALGVPSASTLPQRLPAAGTGPRRSAAVPGAGARPQQPAEGAFRDQSRFAAEVGTSRGHAGSALPVLEALPGALSTAEELGEQHDVAVIEATPSHNPCQKLDFGRAPSKVQFCLFFDAQSRQA